MKAKIRLETSCILICFLVRYFSEVSANTSSLPVGQSVLAKLPAGREDQIFDYNMIFLHQKMTI